MFPPPLAILPQIAGGRRAVLNFLADRSGLLVCALFLLAGLALAGEYGINYDEATQRHIAAANWDYILGREDDILVNADTTALELSDRLYGIAFELPLLLAERALGLTDYYQIHRLRLTLTHLFFILGGYFCYRLVYRLGGSRPIAILALLFYLLHPRLYAQSYLNSKDPVFLSMFVIALYLLERAFRRDTLGAFVLLGIGVGLLTNLRIMGLMLLPAILAMRVLDLFYARTGPERKAILRTGGLFLLTAGLTWYALSPYAWGNPVDYLAASLNEAVNHTPVLSQLFQGARIPSDQLPPHYLPVWFGITTPPFILLLGLIGAAVAVAGGLCRPGAVFRNTRRRLQLLLLALLLLPPLAAALLDSNQYEGWRHSFFLYAPFCLLAAVGLGGLTAALARQRRWRRGVYGLAGLGLGLTLFQMVQIHPLQYSYFNFLVDRTTPERLRTQYEMDYWQLGSTPALQYLLARHPNETLVARTERRHRNILPPAGRPRLQVAAGGRNADYDLIYRLDPSQPDLAFNSVYRRQLYNNTIIAVRPLDAARMTDTAIAAYREIYRDAVAGEPIIRADYDVYLDSNRLTFIQENCPPDSPDFWFGARLFPHRPETLPPHWWRPGSYITLENNRAQLGDTCLVVIQLPDYAAGDLILSRRHSGNWGPAAGLPLWEELYSLSDPGLRKLIADYRRQQPPPAAPDAFEVFIDRDAGRHRLLYAKRDCAPADYATPITLHITPADLADLPAYNRGRNFDNRDFPLDHYGGRPGGECIAVVPLPDYPIASIRTGQAGIWEVTLYPPADPNYLRETYRDVANRQPDARAAFDLHRQDNRLIYLRESCAAADMAANFFLHIIPADISDLPAERRPAGFANLDFAFARWGGIFDGKCLAVVPLPDYPIKEIRTGQYIPGQGELWVVELMVGR